MFVDVLWIDVRTLIGQKRWMSECSQTIYLVVEKGRIESFNDVKREIIRTQSLQVSVKAIWSDKVYCWLLVEVTLLYVWIAIAMWQWGVIKR